MSSICRKICNHWSIIRSGIFAERFNLIIDVFNRTMRLLRLRNWFHIFGKHYFFSIDSFAERSKTEDLPQDEFPFQMTKETDPNIIPQLIECLEGNSDYSYLSTEMLVEKFEKFLQHGSIAWVTWENNQIIGFFWTTVGYYSVPCWQRKLTLELKENMAFIEFIFIKVSHRRKNIYSGMFKQVARIYPATQFSCLVNSFNIPSIKAQFRLGFKLFGSLFCFMFFCCFLASIRFGTTRKWLFQPKKDVPYTIEVKEH